MKKCKKVLITATLTMFSVMGCHPSYASDMLIKSDTAGSVDTRALNFCEEKGSSMLRADYKGDTITITCYDDPQTTYTFVR